MWIYGSVAFLCCLTVQGEEECEPGKYGDGCSKSCSQNCEPLPNGIVLCRKETGECFEGCKGGVYGDRCNEPCSKNCQGHVCNQHNGHCTRGCIENHIGVFCEIYNGITIVHQGTTYSSAGTTYSSHTTVTTGVSPTGSSQVIIPVVVTVLVLILILILILVGAVVIFKWCRKKKKKKSQRDPGGEEGFPLGSPPDGQDMMKEIQEMKEMMMSMRKMKPGSPQPSDSSGIYTLSKFLDTEAPVSETQIECGRRETGSNQGDSAWSEGIALIPGSSQKSIVPATLTAARGGARADQDLHAACWKGNLAEVKRILEAGRTDVNCRGVLGMTPLMMGAWRGHRDVMELLVSRGADVSLVDDVGNTTLHWACLVGNRKTVEFVLSLDGVDVNSRGWTPVMVAARWGHKGVVELLVSHGADVSPVDDVGNNILHYACLRGDRKTVEVVPSLEGVDINARNNTGQTAVDET